VIADLRERGMVLGDLPNGMAQIRCPFNSQHAKAMMGANDWFKCFDPDCWYRTSRDVEGWIWESDAADLAAINARSGVSDD
jgi:hypothetical protein